MKIKQTIAFFPILLVLYEIATYLSNDMYLPALPQMMRELSIDTQQVQLTLTTWFLGSAAMPLVMGAISDRFGRRPILLTGGIIYIIATIICALTTSFSTLMIARFIQGGMVSSMLVPGYACIHEYFEQKEAIRILALMASISVLAPAFGPLLGSFILLIANWRYIFWFIAIWTFIVLAMLYKWMPETHPVDKRLTLHMGKLMGRYWRVLTNWRFMLLMLVLGFIFAGFLAWIAAGPLLIIVNFQHSAVFFGWVQALIFIVYIIGARWVERLLVKYPVNKLIYIGLIITLTGGLLLLCSGLIFPNTLLPFLLAMIVYSFGSALCFAPLNRIIIETSTEPMGIRVALFMVFITGFAALGSASAGMTFNGTIFSLALLTGGASILASLMMLLSYIMMNNVKKRDTNGYAENHSN